MLNQEKNKFVFMITQIRGRLIEKSPTELVVDCNGIGYSINISLNTFSKIGSDENIKLYTHLIIKEDSHSLYGFFEKSERSLFRLLISVSGVGASTGRMMLSSLSPNEIVSAIMTENVQVIQSIKGIGLKTSQRVILELKDKVLSLEGSDPKELTLINESDEAASALEVLGYSQKQTSKILSKIIAENPGINVETLIKKALNKL
jgi:Holliday junction DNA helicase RuvA